MKTPFRALSVLSQIKNSLLIFIVAKLVEIGVSEDRSVRTIRDLPCVPGYHYPFTCLLVFVNIMLLAVSH
jgi:hypothetical protein